jgi:hypothetical protein
LLQRLNWITASNWKNAQGFPPEAVFLRQLEIASAISNQVVARREDRSNAACMFGLAAKAKEVVSPARVNPGRETAGLAFRPSRQCEVSSVLHFERMNDVRLERTDQASQALSTAKAAKSAVVNMSGQPAGAAPKRPGDSRLTQLRVYVLRELSQQAVDGHAP